MRLLHVVTVVLLSFVLVVVFAVAADAARFDQEVYHPIAHDNYIDQGRCWTVPDHGFTRCTLAHGRQWVKSADGGNHLAIAVWHPNRSRAPWLIAKSQTTGRIWAYPATAGDSGPVLFVGSAVCSRDPNPDRCKAWPYSLTNGISRATLRDWADRPMSSLPADVGRELWETAYVNAGGKHLDVFDRTILPCESEFLKHPDAAIGYTHDYGRAQINRAVWKSDFEATHGVPWEWVHDPHYNARQAARIERLQGLTAWVCYQ